MNKINLYLFNNTLKYIFINIVLISLFVVFINLIEISRVLEKENQNFSNYIFLSLIKIPTVVNETIAFIIIISIAFIPLAVAHRLSTASLISSGKF